MGRFNRWLFTRKWFQRPLRRLVSGLLNQRWDYSRGGNYATEDALQAMYSRTLVEAFGWQLELHGFYTCDNNWEFHSHPALSYRFILSGGYEEEYLALGEDLDQARTGVVPLSRRSFFEGMGGWVYPHTVHSISQVLPSASAPLNPYQAACAPEGVDDHFVDPCFTLWLCRRRNRVKTRMFNIVERFPRTGRVHYEQVKIPG